MEQSYLQEAPTYAANSPLRNGSVSFTLGKVFALV